MTNPDIAIVAAESDKTNASDETTLSTVDQTSKTKLDLCLSLDNDFTLVMPVDPVSFKFIPVSSNFRINLALLAIAYDHAQQAPADPIYISTSRNLQITYEHMFDSFDDITGVETSSLQYSIAWLKHLGLNKVKISMKPDVALSQSHGDESSSGFYTQYIQVFERLLIEAAKNSQTEADYKLQAKEIYDKYCKSNPQANINIKDLGKINQLALIKKRLSPKTQLLHIDDSNTVFERHGGRTGNRVDDDNLTIMYLPTMNSQSPNKTYYDAGKMTGLEQRLESYADKYESLPIEFLGALYRYYRLTCKLRRDDVRTKDDSDLCNVSSLAKKFDVVKLHLKKQMELGAEFLKILRTVKFNLQTVYIRYKISEKITAVSDELRKILTNYYEDNINRQTLAYIIDNINFSVANLVCGQVIMQEFLQKTADMIRELKGKINKFDPELVAEITAVLQPLEKFIEAKLKLQAVVPEVVKHSSEDNNKPGDSEQSTGDVELTVSNVTPQASRPNGLMAS